MADRRRPPSKAASFLVGLATLLAACGPTPGPMAGAAPGTVSGLSAARAGETRLIVKYRNPSARKAVDGRVQSLAAAGAQPLGAVGMEVVTVPAGTDVAAMMRTLSQDPNVEFVDVPHRMSLPRRMRRAKPPTVLPPVTGVAGRDPLRKQQWALATVEADAAWKLSAGSPNVVVAIIDSGIDPNHPEFKGKLIDPWSAVGGSHNYRDEDGHGTHCAGIAAAAAGNGTGISGIAPNVKIMPVRVLDAKGEGEDKDIAAGVLWAANHGASVISMSVGSDTASKVLREAIAYAQRKNCLVVAAMGNDGNSLPNFPAQYKGVMSVGATDAGDKLADFSNRGNWISVTAPGVDILSTMPTYSVTSTRDGASQGYSKDDGTSMATPYVAGLAALLRSRYPELSQEQVKSRIEQSADDLGPKGFDVRFGHGRINARRALAGF